MNFRSPKFWVRALALLLALKSASVLLANRLMLRLPFALADSTDTFFERLSFAGGS